MKAYFRDNAARGALFAVASTLALACSQDAALPKSGTPNAAPVSRVTTVALRNEIPLCDLSRFGQVYYVMDDDAFYYCDGAGLEPLDVIGQPGADGTSWLVSLADASPEQCESGGTVLHVGPDADADGMLDASEIAASQAICNGKDGEKGDTGEQGLMGETGPAGTDGADGVPCSVTDNLDGSKTITCGGDSVTVNDGVSTLISLIDEPPGANCAAGGTQVRAGADLDGDGTLQESEITQTSFVCNGLDAPVPVVAHFDDETCDPAAVPDAEAGIFVDASLGSDVYGNGTSGFPLKSLAQATAMATAMGRTRLYLAEGEYGQVLHLPVSSALFVEGGWTRAGSEWHRRCDTGARDATVIRGAVVASGVDGGLRSLTAIASGGRSNVAVRVASGQFAVRDCVLHADPGADGIAGGTGDDGMPGSGVSDSDCGGGEAGPAGGDGSASNGGTFNPDGSYNPGDGIMGLPGGSGSNGTHQEAWCITGSCGAHSEICGYDQCPYQCNPYPCSYPCGFLNTCTTTCYQTCYSDCNPYYCSVCDGFTSSGGSTVRGYCGLGGLGGRGGLGGQGGGVSVALAVAAGASAQIYGSELVAADGGDGAPGGVGGEGGPGSAGEAQSATCMTGSCGSSCTPVTTTVSAGAGPGGIGGPGGVGGGGAGGHSFAVARMGSATVILDAASTLAHGAAGIGAAGAPDGSAGLVVVQP